MSLEMLPCHWELALEPLLISSELGEPIPLTPFP